MIVGGSNISHQSTRDFKDRKIYKAELVCVLLICAFELMIIRLVRV